MNVWKVIVPTLVIFGAGVITGGLVVGFADRSWPHNRNQQVAVSPGDSGGFSNRVPIQARLPAPMMGPLRKEFLDRMEQELRLTPAQTERTGKIINQGQEETRQVWQQIEPNLRREMMKTRNQIRRELTPEQQTHFDEMMRQRPREQKRPPPFREGPASLPGNQN